MFILYVFVFFLPNLVLCSSSHQKKIAQSLKEEQMKQMSQDSTFSDVQLEDADGRRNSSVGLCLQIVIVFFFFCLFFSQH